jgi:transposase
MKNISTVGIDLAKNVFQLHGTDAKGKRVFSKRLTRNKLPEFMANLTPCLVGIEACGSAHYWARQLTAMGHRVKMMSPQFVKPYIKSNKNDSNDAAGIAEAVTRPDMRFVPIKTVAQQEGLLIHRARELMLKQRTAQANQLRGFLMEFGIVLNQGVSVIRTLPVVLEDNKAQLGEKTLVLFTQLYEHFKTVDEAIKQYDEQLEQVVKEEPMCQQLMEIRGVGTMIASAAVATIGDAKAFKRGREVSAWLGLVPKQRSSGNKERLLGISKRGDSYLRKLLIHGARAVLRTCETKTDKLSVWATGLKKRRGMNKAAVALANKNARIIWAMMSTGEAYRKAA